MSMPDPKVEALIRQGLNGPPPQAVEAAVVDLTLPDGTVKQVPMPMQSYLLFNELHALNEKFDKLIELLTP